MLPPNNPPKRPLAFRLDRLQGNRAQVFLRKKLERFLEAFRIHIALHDVPLLIGRAIMIEHDD